MQHDDNELAPLDPAVERLLQELARRRVGLVVEGDRLRFFPRSVVTPELVAGLRMHKAELQAILTAAPFAADCEIPLVGRVAEQWESAIDPPAPCPQCGCLELWWNILGEARCMKCEPATKANALRALVERIRHVGSRPSN